MLATKDVFAAQTNKSIPISYQHKKSMRPCEWKKTFFVAHIIFSRQLLLNYTTSSFSQVPSAGQGTN